MASNPLTVDQAFGPSTPTADEAFGQDQGQAPTSGSFADYMYSTLNPFKRVLNAFSQGAQQSWGADANNLSPESEQELKKAGIHKDFKAQSDSYFKAFNEGVIRPTLQGLGIDERAPGALLSGINQATQQTGTELKSAATNIEDDKTESPYGIGKNLVATALGGAGEALGAIPEGFLPDSFPELVTKARSIGAVGEGEQGYFNTKAPTPEDIKARDEAAQESGLPKAPPVQATVTDIHQIAREINPEVFNEYDAKSAYHEELKDRLEASQRPDFLIQGQPELLLPKSPELLQIEEAYKDNYNRLLELNDQINQSYKHAQELIPEQQTFGGVEEEKEPPKYGAPEGYEAPTPEREALDREFPRVPEQPTTASTEPIQGDTQPFGTSAQPTQGTSPVPSEALTKQSLDGGSLLKPLDGTGESKPLGLSKGLIQEAIDKGLIKDQRDLGELPEFKSLSFEDQRAKITDLINNNSESALKIVTGEETVPSHLSPTLFFKAMERKAFAEGDLSLLTKLKDSPLSEHGSALGQGLAGLRNTDELSPVSLMKEVEKARQEKYAKLTDQLVKDIKENMKNQLMTPEEVQAFIRSIECDY